MKKILVIVLLACLSLNVWADKYYCATTGDDDTGDGSISTPWKSWDYSFNQLVAGDTLYIRGGIYTDMTGEYSGAYYGLRIVGTDGAEGNPITVLNYPSEVPILDCSSLTTFDGIHYGIFHNNTNYWYISGLTVRNVKEYDAGGGTYKDAYSWVTSGNNITLSQCISHDSGLGFVNYADEMYYIDCDSHDQFDYKNNGENGDGFINGTSAGQTVYYTGCRSWNNADDGFDSYNSAGYIYYTNCWAFNNGAVGTDGDGNGFKLGKVYAPKETGVQRACYNCVSAHNLLSGFDESADGAAIADIDIINCTSYDNYYGFSFYDESITGTVRLINCLAYNNTTNANGRSENTVTTCTFLVDNSENPAFTVTDADFVSVDSTGMSGTRGSDGSLPTLNFLHLVSASDLKDGGTVTTITSDGDGNKRGYLPDLGAFEYQDIKYLINGGKFIMDNGKMVIIHK